MGKMWHTSKPPNKLHGSQLEEAETEADIAHLGSHTSNLSSEVVVGMCVYIHY